jgi:hypothetical protein
MNDASGKIPVQSCPSCGSALNKGAMTCHSCGGLVVVEKLFGQLKAETRFHVGRVNEFLRDRTNFLWFLALCPIVIFPPVFAIFFSLRAWAVNGNQKPPRTLPAPDTLLIIAAISNLTLSVIFWRWMGDAIISMGLYAGFFLKSLGVHHPLGTQI